jgi:hypothetical protein
LSESVQLVKPGAPGAGGFASDVLVDRIDYSALDPWPMPANPGVDSLQRIVSSNYGNEPLNWKTGAPTAGASNTGGAPADSDGDGLPDSWELAHFGNLSRDGSGDFDGDGMTDLAEYLAGTDPTNAADALAIASADLAGGGVTLRFNAVAGRSYRIEFSDALTAPNWQSVQDFPSVATSGQLEVTDPAGNVQTRFYRLVLY